MNLREFNLKKTFSDGGCWLGVGGGGSARGRGDHVNDRHAEAAICRLAGGG
jgi:hypothetical protein